eukprot:scaffold17202_cov67-Phaeocystis_antarctica.AAC.1
MVLLARSTGSHCGIGLDAQLSCRVYRRFLQQCNSLQRKCCNSATVCNVNLWAAVLTTTLVAAPPALRPLAAKGTTRAPSGALSLQPTIPVIPANLNMRSKAQ